MQQRRVGRALRRVGYRLCSAKFISWGSTPSPSLLPSWDEFCHNLRVFALHPEPQRIECREEQQCQNRADADAADQYVGKRPPKAGKRKRHETRAWPRLRSVSPGASGGQWIPPRLHRVSAPRQGHAGSGRRESACSASGCPLNQSSPRMALKPNGEWKSSMVGTAPTKPERRGEEHHEHGGK